jgi:hypothetical protein
MVLASPLPQSMAAQQLPCHILIAMTAHEESMPIQQTARTLFSPKARKRESCQGKSTRSPTTQGSHLQGSTMLQVLKGSCSVKAPDTRQTVVTYDSA